MQNMSVKFDRRSKNYSTHIDLIKETKHQYHSKLHKAVEDHELRRLDNASMIKSKVGTYVLPHKN